jgi:hypothetical protein
MSRDKEATWKGCTTTQRASEPNDSSTYPNMTCNGCKSNLTKLKFFMGIDISCPTQLHGLLVSFVREALRHLKNQMSGMLTRTFFGLVTCILYTLS